jgi:DNA-binding PucR family transcriptional regulator
MKSLNTNYEKLESLKQPFYSLDEFADHISSLLGCPITIEDANHRVLAYSKHTENIDHARIETIMNRQVPEEVINALWKSGVMPQLIDHSQPVVIPEIKEIGLGNRIAISIWKKNEILGFIWAHTGQNEIVKIHSEILQEAAKQVKKIMMTQLPGRKDTEQVYKDFFWQLLTADTVSKSTVAAYESQFNIKLQKNLAVVVFHFHDQVHEKIAKHAYYLSETETQVNTIFRMFDGDDFILLVRLWKDTDPSEKIEEFIRHFIEKISAQLNLTSVQGGASRVYDDTNSLTYAYEEALNTLSLEKQFPETLNDTYLFEDLGVFQWAAVIKEHYKSFAQNKYVRRLEHYDAKQQGNLLHTLECYLKNDSNVSQAAENLFIHPNTMNYRLRRITEVCGLDLRDPNQKTAVYLELLIREMNS